MENFSYFTTVGDADNMSMDSNYTAGGHRSKNSLAYIHFIIGSYILCANSLVIIAVKNYQYLRTRANIYIVSLAGTDVCVGVMEWVVGLHNHSILAEWFDRTGSACVGMFSFAFFSVACSMFNMVLIALDRLLYIMKPFFYGRVVTSTKVKLVIAFVWLLAGIWGSVPLYRHTYDEKVAVCTMQLAIPSWYRVYANVPLLFSGAMTTGVIYIIIALKAIQHKNAILKSNPGIYKIAGDTSNLSEAAKSAISNLRSNLKTLKLFCIVFGLLVFCWFPYYVIEFASDFIYIKDAYYRASTALGFLNSGINFIVYPLYNRKFRRALKTMLCPCCLTENDRKTSDQSFITSTTKSGGVPKPVMGKIDIAKPLDFGAPKPSKEKCAPTKPVLGNFAPASDRPEPFLGTFGSESAMDPLKPVLRKDAPLPEEADLEMLATALGTTSATSPVTPSLVKPVLGPASPHLGRSTSPMVIPRSVTPTSTVAPSKLQTSATTSITRVSNQFLTSLSESCHGETISLLTGKRFFKHQLASYESDLTSLNDYSVDSCGLSLSCREDTKTDLLPEKKPSAKGQVVSKGESSVDRLKGKGKTASSTSHPSCTHESSSDM